MNQKDKELLLKDLCARLPYRVIVDYKENEFESPHWRITTIYPETMDGWIGYNKRIGAGSESGSRPFKIGDVKPYLRPMSSMTEEEKGELWFLLTEGRTNIELNSNGQLTTRENIELGFNYPFVCPEGSTLYVDWLNAHHFDYRSLIPMDLAIAVTKENNPYKE